MESRIRLFGHPIHQMLVAFPLGLLGGSVAFDLLAHLLDRPLLSVVAHYLISAGLLTGLLAAPFGTVDWLAIPNGTRAKSVGRLHALGNVLVLGLFGASWWLRREAPAEPGLMAQCLSFAGALLSLLTAWLGGELVDRLGVGVYNNAHLNAPSSLRRQERQPAPVAVDPGRH